MPMTDPADCRMAVRTRINRILMPATLSDLPESLKRPLRSGYDACAALVSQGRRALGLAPWQHLLVCGFPRSGTSLVYNMLSATLPGFRFLEFEQGAAHWIGRPGFVASKAPLDVLDVSRILSRNRFGKELLVLVPLRDVRDVVTSIHPKLPDRYFIGYDHSWWPQKGGWTEWKYDAAGVGQIAEAIRGLDGIPGARVMKLRYEDLLANPDEGQARIAAAFGLEFQGKFADYHRSADKLPYRYQGSHAARDPGLVREDKPVDLSRAGKWRKPEHRARIVEQFTRFPQLFDLLVEHGYEPDRSWYESLVAGEGRAAAQ